MCVHVSTSTSTSVKHSIPIVLAGGQVRVQAQCGRMQAHGCGRCQQRGFLTFGWIWLEGKFATRKYILKAFVLPLLVEVELSVELVTVRNYALLHEGSRALLYNPRIVSVVVTFCTRRQTRIYYGRENKGERGKEK